MANSIFAPSFSTSFAPTDDELNAIEGQDGGNNFSLDLAFIPTMVEVTMRANPQDTRRVCIACAAHLAASRVVARVVNVAAPCANGHDCLRRADTAPIAPMERLARVMHARS